MTILHAELKGNQMLDVDALISQVLHNCGISDARYAGLYSICGLALRLRDLYKWENGLNPWVEADSAHILDWIGNKEEEWERLAELDFEEIRILGRGYDPFDASGVNGILEPRGLYYGAGYVQGLRPTFFLAWVADKKEMNGWPVYILGRELARDILTLPALTQGDCILVRRESAKLFLWDQILFTRKSGRKALTFALESYGLNERDSDSLRSNLGRIVAGEMDSYVYHELGELRDTVFDRDVWRGLIAAFPQTPIEILARTVKDFLADTNEFGKLRYIVRERRAGSLGFHVAFLDGLRKELFPELVAAFEEFMTTHNWAVVEQAVSIGYATASRYAAVMGDIYEEGTQRNDMKWAAERMRNVLLGPLGIGESSSQREVREKHS